MQDIILETLRALIVAVIFISLSLAGKKDGIRDQPGWIYIISGFGFLLFGMLIDITDNFPSLNQYVLIGDTPYEAFLEKVLGYLVGFLLLAIGFLKWLPSIVRLKEASTSLKYANLEWEKTFNAISDFISIHDKDFRLLKVNTAFADFLGKKPEELIGKRCHEVVHNMPSPPAFCPHLKTMETKNAVIMDVENDVVGFPALISTYPIFDDNGDVIESVHIVRDISARKKAEMQILNQNELLNNILNSMTHPFYVIDANDYTIKLSNQAAHLETGDKNMTCYELTHHSDIPCDDAKHPCTIKKIKETKAAVTLEHIHHDKDGNPRIIEIHGYPIFDSNGNIAQVIEYNLDITERKEADEERRRLNKELEQIIYVTSHDLRSPLVNVEGYHKEVNYSLNDLKNILEEIEIPEDKKEKIAFIIDRDIPESVKYIDASVAKMDSLLSGLLRLSRSGKAELEMKKLDMNRLVSDVLDTLEYQFKEKGAGHEVAELPSCSGDDKHINQAFSNLIGNALKYLDPARPGVIRITGCKKDGQAVYCVEDNGIGIPAEHQDKIFDIFHQVQRGKGGEGLGLSIVKKIVKRHNGKVWVESEFGKGSKFYVSLPV